MLIYYKRAGIKRGPRPAAQYRDPFGGRKLLPCRADDAWYRRNHLTIGYAVDSNVLIFRTYPRRTTGRKSVIARVDAGYWEGLVHDRRHPRHHGVSWPSCSVRRRAGQGLCGYVDRFDRQRFFTAFSFLGRFSDYELSGRRQLQN